MSEDIHVQYDYIQKQLDEKGTRYLNSMISYMADQSYMLQKLGISIKDIVQEGAQEVGEREMTEGKTIENCPRCKEPLYWDPDYLDQFHCIKCDLKGSGFFYKQITELETTINLIKENMIKSNSDSIEELEKEFKLWKTEEYIEQENSKRIEKLEIRLDSYRVQDNVSWESMRNLFYPIQEGLTELIHILHTKELYPKSYHKEFNDMANKLGGEKSKVLSDQGLTDILPTSDFPSDSRPPSNRIEAFRKAGLKVVTNIEDLEKERPPDATGLIQEFLEVLRSLHDYTFINVTDANKVIYLRDNLEDELKKYTDVVKG